MKYKNSRLIIDGVNVDFESFPPSQKENMVTFISDLTQSFH